MAFLYQRGTKLYVGFKGKNGRWKYITTGLGVADRALAERVKESIEAKIAAGEIPCFMETSPPTVKQYGERWSEGRRALVADAKNEAARLVKHVYPRIGHMLVRDVKPRHVIGLVKDLRMSGKLAPRTVHHTYGIVHVLFRDAVIDEVIAATPCVLTKAQLGKKEDKDPEWRAGAVYSREELETLVSSDDVPWDRQIMYALEGVAGLRHGEAAGVRWRNYDPQAKPLGRIVVARSYDHPGTKTMRSREVPAHPLLAAMLAEWRLKGWAEMTGRVPSGDDLIIPSRTGEMRSRHHSRNKLLDDLARLGLRHRRGHDLRRTFVTLCRVDGARADILEMGDALAAGRHRQHLHEHAVGVALRGSREAPDRAADRESALDAEDGGRRPLGEQSRRGR